MFPEFPAQPPITKRSYRVAWATLRRLGAFGMIALAVVVGLNLAWPRYMVQGASMRPMFVGDGEERVMVNRLEYFINAPQRGDIVVLLNPQDEQTYYIKRLVGLPGEWVALVDGTVFINGVRLQEPYIERLCHATHCRYAEWQLGPNEYFVLGDNRNASHDSAVFGPVDRSMIVGRAWVHYWPPEEFQVIDHYQYKNK